MKTLINARSGLNTANPSGHPAGEKIMNASEPLPQDNPGALIPSSPHPEEEDRGAMGEEFDDTGFAGRLAKVLLLPARLAALIRSWLWRPGRSSLEIDPADADVRQLLQTLLK